MGGSPWEPGVVGDRGVLSKAEERELRSYSTRLTLLGEGPERDRLLDWLRSAVVARSVPSGPSGDPSAAQEEPPTTSGLPEEAEQKLGSVDSSQPANEQSGSGEADGKLQPRVGQPADEPRIAGEAERKPWVEGEEADGKLHPGTGLRPADERRIVGEAERELPDADDQRLSGELRYGEGAELMERQQDGGEGGAGELGVAEQGLEPGNIARAHDGWRDCDTAAAVGPSGEGSKESTATSAPQRGLSRLLRIAWSRFVRIARPIEAGSRARDERGTE